MVGICLLGAKYSQMTFKEFRHKYIWNNFLSQITEFYLKRQVELQFFLFGECNFFFLIYFNITKKLSTHLKNYFHWKISYPSHIIKNSIV